MGTKAPPPINRGELSTDPTKDRLVPRHVAVVMDGNGRWAQARGKARIQGHRRGVETARQLTSLCGRAGIEYLTLFAFSSENWKRPSEEVRFLTRLLITSLENEISRLQENQIRLNVIGDFRPFGQKVEELIVRAHEQTFSNTAMTPTPEGPPSASPLSLTRKRARDESPRFRTDQPACACAITSETKSSARFVNPSPTSNRGAVTTTAP